MFKHHSPALIVKHHGAAINEYYRAGNLTAGTLSILPETCDDVAVKNVLNLLQEHTVAENISHYNMSDTKRTIAAFFT